MSGLDDGQTLDFNNTEAQAAEAEKNEKAADMADVNLKVEAEKPAPTPEQLLAEANDKQLRLRADFDNYRKRMAREADETRERAKIIVVSDFLPVYDFFKMAMEHSDDVAALKQGMQMIMNEFTRALDDLGVKEINAVGQVFDPKLHDAIKTENSDTVPADTVIAQWKSGYKIGERLVRPATVVVSSGPKPIEVTEEKQETTKNTESKDEENK